MRSPRGSGGEGGAEAGRPRWRAERGAPSEGASATPKGVGAPRGDRAGTGGRSTPARAGGSEV